MGNRISFNEHSDLVSKFSHFNEEDVYEWIIQFNTLFPSGYIRLEDLQFILTLLFPFGDSKNFSKILFNNINLSETGEIDITEFLISFSILLHGSEFEKIRWTHRLFDVDGDGVVSKRDVVEALLAYNEMVKGMFDEIGPEIIEKMFEDINSPNNYISFDRFRKYVEENKMMMIFSNF